MTRKRERFGSRKAFVSTYMVFSSLTLIPVVGLAIDFSVLYNVKSRLQLACDAGAIGAGSLVQRSTDVTDPTTNASLRASILRYFNANFNPVPWRSTQLSYTSSVTQDTNKVRTIFVTATYNVPMLFMRVIGISNSRVAAQAIAKLRYVNMIIVVDRSGSVSRTGSGTQTNQQIIEDDLDEFVGSSSTSIFKNGRDVVGLLTFGGNYNLDFAPITNFQTASPNISSAINAISFGTSNSTNTGEGLYQGWYQLTQLNQSGALNVILLITDGRPSAFTGNFAVNTSISSCTDRSNKVGVMTSAVSDGNPWQFPPPANRTISGVLKVTPASTNEPNTQVTNSAGCAFAGNNNASHVTQDITTIPNPIGPADHTTGTFVPAQTTFSSTSGYFTSGGTNATSPTAIRYTAYNYAYNVAQAMRQDTTYAPVIYCIGLNFNSASYPAEEPLDADFLATLANDPSYTSSGKPSGVYQQNQTAGKYYNVSYSGLAAALQDISGQILRLTAH